MHKKIPKDDVCPCCGAWWVMKRQDGKRYTLDAAVRRECQQVRDYTGQLQACWLHWICIVCGCDVRHEAYAGDTMWQQMAAKGVAS